MILDKGGYGTVGSGFHEGLWGVPIPVVHHTPLGLYPAPYNGMSFLDGN